MRTKIILVFLFLNAAVTAVLVFLFLRLDQVVHGDLYGYGLLFDYGWAVPYWTYARSILALIGVQIALTVTATVLILADVRTFEKQRLVAARFDFKPGSKLVSFTLLSAGSLALAFSINYVSRILAFIGLGLILWGVLLLYAVSDKHVAEKDRKLSSDKTPED